MSRRMIYTLSVVMAIAAASLIGVQMMTIKHTAELQEKNFSTQAIQALQEVCDNIGFYETSQFYTRDGEQSDLPDNSSELFPNSDPNLSLSALVEKGEISV